MTSSQQTQVNNRVTNGTVTKAATLDDLADALSIDKATLTATVNAYNLAIDNQTAPGFGLPLDGLTKLDTAPYYAEMICATEYGSVVSIKIDEFGRILNSTSRVIPGLYASGECTMGNIFPGGYYHGGFGMGVAAYTGVLVARTVVDDLTE
jgi:hypothetical protein